ncbi:Activating signal cointegrator 1 [Coccomyxa sp. Obi]|nr:Activating signal cointegrator 1 [Coccomyxa sp. Obi]
MHTSKGASQEHCLSLHQPWASLLVHGIKRIEGRSWQTSYRGRLWIHSTNKEPDSRHVQELQKFYTDVYSLEGHEPEFPTSYPIGALIGCITLVDVLTAEQVEAWPKLPSSLKLEVGSPCAFLCEDARIMTAPICMRGWPGLWPMPAAIIRKAELFLVSPPQIGPSTFSWSAYKRPENLHMQRPPRNPRRNYFRDTYHSTSRTHSICNRRVLDEPLDCEAASEQHSMRRCSLQEDNESVSALLSMQC